MKRLLVSIVLLTSTICIIAHDHHHRSIEELLVITTELERTVEKQRNIIETQGKVIECQRYELDTLKHRFPEGHHYHSLMQTLRALLGY